MNARIESAGRNHDFFPNPSKIVTKTKSGSNELRIKIETFSVPPVVASRYPLHLDNPSRYPSNSMRTYLIICRSRARTSCVRGVVVGIDYSASSMFVAVSNYGRRTFVFKIKYSDIPEVPLSFVARKLPASRDDTFPSMRVGACTCITLPGFITSPERSITDDRPSCVRHEAAFQTPQEQYYTDRVVVELYIRHLHDTVAVDRTSRRHLDGDGRRSRDVGDEMSTSALTCSRRR
ncbi:hypothetical protein EVAR_55317_1 [Eumeta japonica]|uniref:Uncharacterized protein n=1 Tax=Eumeta variegata TaxID=151549 RepID=A0A4C1ZBS7_EUMVA|nr:hypothetical protein EVAR_55317_1 [Eumeta japonica]